MTAHVGDRGTDSVSWRTPLSAVWAPVLAGAASLVVYLATMAPGVYGFDSAELATGAYTLGIVHPTGYPLYLLLTRLFMFFPVGSIAFRANLASGAFGAGAVFLLAVLAKRLTGSSLASLFGGLALAFSITYWRLSVVAEVYTMHVFLLALALVLAERALRTRRLAWLYAMALAVGLGLSNHASGVLYTPVFALVAGRVLTRKQWLTHGPLLAATAAAGLIPYVYLPLRAAAQPELDYVRDYYGIDLGTLSGLVWMITGQAYRFFAFSYTAADYLREVCGFGQLLWRNFTGVGVLFGIAGAVALARQRGAFQFGLAWVFASTVLFYSGYGVSDKNTMFLPAFLVWAIWLCVGAWSITKWAAGLTRTYGRGITPGGAAVVMAAAALVVFSVGLNWRQADMSGSGRVEALGLETLAAVEPNAVVLGSWSTAVVLEYLQQVEGVRPDVTIFNTSRFEVAEYYRLWREKIPYDQAVEAIFAVERGYVQAMYATRPVYDIGYDHGLARDFEYRPVGTLFRLVARESAGQS